MRKYIAQMNNQGCEYFICWLNSYSTLQVDHLWGVQTFVITCMANTLDAVLGDMWDTVCALIMGKKQTRNFENARSGYRRNVCYVENYSYDIYLHHMFVHKIPIVCYKYDLLEYYGLYTYKCKN